jgi:hypothetical protein
METRPISQPLKRFEIWNRKIHYFLGLYFLFFVWLFAFSGLLLNHMDWKAFEFWENRKESKDERNITSPPAGNDLAQAHDILRQLGLEGEVDWTSSRGDDNRLDFRVTRPGHVIDIKADFEQGKARIKRIDYNAWGLMRTLHTFTGASVHEKNNRNQRDWLLTKVWAFTMDAVAVGLIVMVLSSLYMWYELPEKRRLGTIVLAVGLASCTLFCLGLRWIY